MTDEKPVIEFGKKELDPNEEAIYRDKIAKAKAGVNLLKGNEPLGSVPRPNIPPLTKKSTQSGPIRDETLQELNEAAEATKKMVEKEKKEKEDADKKEEEKKKEEDVFEMFDFDERSEAEKILNNKKRRQDIESRCEPMKFEDLIIRDEVRQKIPIRPSGFEVVFRSLTSEESLFVKRFLSKETSSESYLAEKLILCQLTCGLVSINGKELPDHRGLNGSPDEKLFEEKLKILMKKSGYITADLSLNYLWFDLRVRRLINPENLKNG